MKLDVKDAYRIVPVHPSDYHLLGIRWRDRTYVDRALPFGLRSAPKIFSALADLVAWVLNQQGIRHQQHYLDDFLFLGAPDSMQGAESLAIALRVFEMLGIPVAAHKTEGPTTVLVFLGILIDTQAFELRLLADKLARVQETIRSWVGKKACTRKEWPLVTCSCSYMAGPHIPEAAVSTAVSGQVTTLLCSPQCWCQG